MGTFGERLRREREMRGVGLDEIATATKIGTRSLKALEEEDFSKLPGGIFNKGFVRAYARFLGIDEDQAVADYMSAAGEAEQNSDAVMERLAVESERRDNEKRIERAREKSAEPPFTWNTVAVVVVLAVAAVLGWQYYAKRKALKAHQVTPPAITATAPQTSLPAESPSAAATSPAGIAVPGAANATPQSSNPPPSTNLPTSAADTIQPPAAKAKTIPDAPPAATSSAPPADVSAPGTATSAQEFVVVVKATKSSWVSSSADNQHQPGHTLAPNAQATFRARSNLTLTIGNAGGVEISFNGKPLPAVGEENQKKTLIFTPDGPQ